MNENIFYKLSLKDKENSWQKVISNSLPVKIITFFISLIEKYLAPYSRESVAAKFSEAITMFSIMLLIFLSPFIPTDANATLVIFAVLATSLKHFLRPETISRKTDILTFTVLAYFAISLVAVGSSPYFMASVKGFAKMIIYMLAYFVFLVNLLTIKNIRLIIWTMIAAASIVSAYGVYQFYIKVEPYQGALWDDPNATSYKTTRVYSFLKNPNLLAGYLIPTASLTAVFYYITSGWTRIVVIISLGLQIACLYFTYSRGGWLAVIGMAGVIFLGSLIIFAQKIFKSKILKYGLIASIVLGLAGIIAVLIASPATLERFTSIFTTRGHSSNSFRMNVWISCWEMFKDNLLIGIGPGNTTFELIYPLYMFSGFKALSAYNIFLETAVETGILGLLIFIFMLIIHSFRAIWGIISNIDYSSRILLMGSLAGLSGLIIQGMFDTVWYRPQVHILLWFLLAIITIVSRDEIALKNK
jgi:putative inorganic carbon (HCO3(-)) transporter